MTRYLSILSSQRPFPFNVDEEGRSMFAVNFNAVAAAPVADWERELARILSDAGLATLGTDTFIGPTAVIPTTGDGPFIQIIDSGGVAPLESHSGEKYERLSAQIVVRAASYIDARTRALAIWRELDGKRNATVAA